MALIACSECQKEISSKALSCPSCGAPVVNSDLPLNVGQNRKQKSSGIVWVVLLVLIVGFLWMVLPAISKKQDLPLLPVEVGYRAALVGPGLVLKVKNNSSRTLSILANLNNPTMHNIRNYRLDISPGTTSEVGHLEGWVLASGDRVVLSNVEYQSWEGVIP